ncbi:MAG: hypothetical protein QXG10_04490 [Candidatus Hadarchaeales archaeon]
MKLEIIEKKENKLLKRTEVKFRVEHPGAPTPPRKEVLSGLSQSLGVSEELIALERISGSHGSHISNGIARLYQSREDLVKSERDYLLKRGMPKEAEKPKEEPKKEKGEKSG